MSLINPNAPILVTGASGYVAGWIVKKLLEAGHTVHATVRDPNKAASVAHLQKIASTAPGTLKLFKADLLDQGAFAVPMAGCELVIHTASPFVVTGFTDANAALVRPALEGTRNVLQAVNATNSVRRVVLTSSVAATFGDSWDARHVPGHCLDETFWNTTSSVDHQPYLYSKTVAEQEAWAMQKSQQRWDLVCINPGLVMGPALTTNSISASITTLQQFGDGTLAMGAPCMWNGLVDVRDVADAHIIAGFKPEANGRYILCSESLTLLDMASALRAHFGAKYPFPRMTVPKILFWLVSPFYGYTRDFVWRNMGWPIHFNNARSREELGIQYRDVRQAVCEHFQQLIDDGLVKRRA